MRIVFAGRLLILFFCFDICAYSELKSQSIEIGSINDKESRSLQLLGKIDSSVSLTARPLIISHRKNKPDISGFGLLTQNNFSYKQISKNAKISFLPVQLVQQFNSHHPYGWNDGPMIAAKGYQSLFSAGVYASYGPLEIQIKPEFVFALNNAYEYNAAYGSTGLVRYQKLFPGQSSVRLSAGPFSVGVSSENLWWGPGQFSSLLMSNNAPGFLHAFFKTREPVRTGIGNFEWQLIGGKIVSDGSLPYENYNLKTAPNFLSDWRYLNAFMISYQPKWVPGLFVGFERGLQRYNTDLTLSTSGFVNKYLPVLALPFQKTNVVNDDNKRTDQLASFFMRWVLPKARSEFYFEYGFNDYGQNVRDYVMTPTHSAAYIAGFKKIVLLPKKEERLELDVELTQMSQSPDLLVRDAGNWYLHYQVLQGYTNNNQILGAGAGLGANVQSGMVTWVSGLKKLGLLFERVERDPQYHTSHWIDLSVGVLPQYKYKNLVFTGKFQFINSNNYSWEKDVKRFNLHSRVQIQYVF